MAFGGNGSMKLIILIFKAEMLIFPFFLSLIYLFAHEALADYAS